MIDTPDRTTPPTSEDRALMTAEQLAAYLQASIRTIRDYYQARVIPVAAWIGVSPRFHRPSVLEALSRRTPTTIPPAPIAPPKRITVRRRMGPRRPQEHP